MTVRELRPPCPAFAASQAAEAPDGPAERADDDDASAVATSRLRQIVDDRYDFLWRTLRYLGVPADSIEDAAQQSLCVLARRLDDVAPGAEGSFLFATAVRVASEVRRSARRHPATLVGDIDTFVAPAPAPDELLDERRAHQVLSEVLEAIPPRLRMVFVFFELEELTIAEISRTMGIPAGTVASRLRRAREAFHQVVARRSLRLAGRGGVR